jgi:sugar phosphate isomerase/epimerase
MHTTNEMQSLRDRIGVDLGNRMRAEESLVWAGANGFSYVNICLDNPDNVFDSMDEARIAGIRRLLDEHEIRLGLHTLSGVNTAETSPFVTDATDAYLRAYVDMAPKLGAGWIIVHAGYHFTKDFERRKVAGRDRLQRMADHAEKAGVRILLENMNPEPKDAEVKYLAHDVEECRYYFDTIQSPAFGWSYTVNHAHMLPEGIEGFTRAFDLDMCEEVRLADNRGKVEEHLQPGEGTIDFSAMFDQIEGSGYHGHYMLAFGNAENMNAGREWLLAHTDRR